MAHGAWAVCLRSRTRCLASWALPQDGSRLSILPLQVTLEKGQTRNDTLFIEPTGTLSGVLKDANGALQVARQVVVLNAANTFQRYTTTDTSGRFTFTDMRVGAFTLRSNDPVSGFPATLPVTVVQDQTTDVELRYLGSGTITVTVLRANLTPASGIDVSVSGTGFSRPAQRTGATGLLTFTNIPVGQVATIFASHPSNYQIQVSATATVTPESGGTVATTITMPGYGTISTEVRKPNGTLAGAGVEVNTFGGVSAYGTTDVNSRVTLGPVLLNKTFTLRAYHPTTRIECNMPFLDVAQTALTTDAEVKTANTRYPAVAKLVITVRAPNGDPVVGAKVETMDALFGYFRDRGVTNASGVVEVLQVPEGTFSVRVFQPSTTTVIELATGEVLAANDGGIVNKNITYRLFTVTVRGRIFQADGVTPLLSPSLVELLRGVDRVVLARKCVSPLQCNGDSNPGVDGEVVFPNVTSTGAGLIVRSYAPIGGSSVGTYETTIVPTADGEYIAPITQPFLRATLRGACSPTTTDAGRAGTIFPRTLGNYTTYGTSVLPRRHVQRSRRPSCPTCRPRA